MEYVKENLKNKNLKGTTQLSIILTILLILFEIVLYFWNKAFVILVWMPILPLIHILKRKIFFKNAEFGYGKVVDVILKNDDGDVYRSTKIEFIDYNSKIHETVVVEHWGDFRDEDKDKIDEFYEEGKKRIGKKVPLFYKKENPNKNIIFIDNLEN